MKILRGRLTEFIVDESPETIPLLQELKEVSDESLEAGSPLQKSKDIPSDGIFAIITGEPAFSLDTGLLDSSEELKILWLMPEQVGLFVLVLESGGRDVDRMSRAEKPILLESLAIPTPFDPVLATSYRAFNLGISDLDLWL